MNQKQRFKNHLGKHTVEQVAAEYNLICKKQSKLNAMERKMVCEMVGHLIKKGTLTYKTTDKNGTKKAEN